MVLLRPNVQTKRVLSAACAALNAVKTPNRHVASPARLDIVVLFFVVIGLSCP